MNQPNDIVPKALRATRPALITAVVFSFFINVMALAAPLYMLQVYDRVLVSRSISTLVMLTLIVAFVYAVSATLETIRSKVLIRAGVLFDRVANPDVFRAVQRATILHPSPRHVQSLRDIDTIIPLPVKTSCLASKCATMSLAKLWMRSLLPTKASMRAHFDLAF